MAVESSLTICSVASKLSTDSDNRRHKNSLLWFTTFLVRHLFDCLQQFSWERSLHRQEKMQHEISELPFGSHLVVEKDYLQATRENVENPNHVDPQKFKRT